ncbi:exodeoxyribonuclease V subunit alpha [Buchnera aphidicola (Aphis glycines)]|uniref:RecBCD enzyme subunit RecD n=1 Tax=Buchnera aphidicola (Aphis glycines) TaxID=1265350 RepID=A0A0M4HX72_9GAMM|nr:exodeoxyribonuclease V subunit alpha [Buchnera aphidicola]ALD15384.1 exodeoxyribonuclease V subunit alpha [Buchnera aphidicola (Aphis glycines)]
MKKLLKNLVKQQIIRTIDFIFSQFISKKNNIIMLIAACISFESNNGYLFLPIKYFKKNNFFSIRNKKIIDKILCILNIKEVNWLLELSQHHAFSNGKTITPLVFIENKIYLYKIWKSKKNILKFLYRKNIYNQFDLNNFKFLNELFPKKEYNAQKVAVVLSLIHPITFILGGPGTGKTTTIIKIIIALIKYAKKNIIIQLSAPTGKATSRLIEVLNSSKILNVYLSTEEKKQFLLKPVTIHKLLGISKTSDKASVNEKNLLNIDVLIIDETSMIDVLMMNRILSSIKNNTKIIFIGDPHQLSPIGIGSILKKIYSYANNGYSLKMISILKKIKQYTNLYHKKNTNNTCLISDKICILKKNYRFKNNPEIHVLANGINENKKEIFTKLFNNLIKNIFFYETNCVDKYKTMIKKIIFYYAEYWNKINQKRQIKDVIKTFQKYQILCVVKQGIYGTNSINTILEKTMYNNNIIKKYFHINNQIWYVGKPIIIKKNNKYLNLSNGEIGITNLDDYNKLQVCFLKNNNIIQYVPADLLEDYETAWCITVHKSQGSEFDHITLILPDKQLEILNKEILYTAITRSRKTLSIFSNKKIFTTTIEKQRFSIY